MAVHLFHNFSLVPLKHAHFRLTHKQLEVHQCMLKIVTTDALVQDCGISIPDTGVTTVPPAPNHQYTTFSKSINYVINQLVCGMPLSIQEQGW